MLEAPLVFVLTFWLCRNAAYYKAMVDFKIWSANRVCHEKYFS